MPKFNIAEVDNDYRTIIEVRELEFDNLEAAKAFCEKHSWTAYYYFVKGERKET